MNIASKTIILTGAASGIGYALLTQLAAYDTTIIAVDIQSDALDAVCQKLENQPADIQPFIGDMTQSSEIDRLFERVEHIDIFIANAGFAYYEKLNAPDWQHIERIYQLNTLSPIYAATQMAQHNQGRDYKMVITASAMGHWALPGYALYSSTKAALHSFATAYRQELDDPNTLMLVYPIATRTNFFERAGETAQQIAPTPFPSQTADEVAHAIIKGIEQDKQAVYPAMIFRIVKFLNRVLPIQWLNRQLETRAFKNWLSKQK
ncbi:MAG: SDR family NAD(P)-dependent oxidoreductase [Phototrophicaceae bacterium]